MAAEVVSLLFPVGWKPVRAQAGKAHGVLNSLPDARKIMDVQEKTGKQEKGTTAVADGEMLLQQQILILLLIRLLTFKLYKI